jgi:hypothetical protein
MARAAGFINDSIEIYVWGLTSTSQAMRHLVPRRRRGAEARDLHVFKSA